MSSGGVFPWTSSEEESGFILWTLTLAEETSSSVREEDARRAKRGKRRLCVEAAAPPWQTQFDPAVAGGLCGHRLCGLVSACVCDQKSPITTKPIEILKQLINRDETDNLLLWV